jgi:thiol-disulfide isomerase/thioredoxin
MCCRRTIDFKLNMSKDFGIFSRRAVVSGIACMTASSAALSQTDGPPLLRTRSAQFIEMRPAVVAPPLRIERIDGKHIDPTSLRGKVVLVNFWATWCPPCRRELPLLEKLQEIVGPKLLEIVAVSIDAGGRPAVEAFLKRANVTRLRPYLDPQGRIAARTGEDESAPFALYGMPISYVIDRQGRVAGYITGEVDWTGDDGLALLKYYMTI